MIGVEKVVKPKRGRSRSVKERFHFAN